MFERLGTREVFANPWLRLREDRIRYPDGAETTYTVLERRDFAAVLAREDDGFWLVEQYRYPLQRRLWEVPQGAWPAGRTGTPLELAQTELREETGFVAGRWTHLGRLAPHPGLARQYYDVFLAEQLTPGPHAREHTEQDMRQQWFADHDLRARIRAGEIIDSHTVAALGLYELQVRRAGG